jgi:putative transposase
VDGLQRRWSLPTTRHRKRYRLQRAARRVRLRIRNLVDELHKRLAKWLCERHKVVLLPKFESSQMVKGKGLGRKLHSKTARAMLTLSHFRFRQRVLQKSRSYPSCTVAIVDEPYTSKTCGACGHLHQTLGSSKVFRCPRAGCGYVSDRDVNGARNILLRYLTLRCATPALHAELLSAA